MFEDHTHAALSKAHHSRQRETDRERQRDRQTDIQTDRYPLTYWQAKEYTQELAKLRVALRDVAMSQV